MHAPTPAAPRGLTSAEASARLRHHGPNVLAEQPKAERLVRALRMLADPMALMLLAAAGCSFLAGEPRDGTVLLAALVPILAVDVVLEARSRSALARLAAAVAPRAPVVRDGVETDVATEDIVPGDVLVLLEGAVVPADGVVLVANNLSLDESSLTGESLPQARRAVLPGAAASDDTIVNAGSVILAGKGLAEVTATGVRTRYGRIARLVAGVSTELTPIQRRTGRLVRVLGAVAIVVAVAVFGLLWWRGQPPLEAMLSAISLAMAAIPEEYALVFALFLALGAWRLARHGVLVRRIASVETLGSTTVLCIDKTGTLTRGEFVLDALVPIGGASMEDLLLAALLASEPEPADPLERALVSRAEAEGMEHGRVLAAWRLETDHDFEPSGRHVTHVWTSIAGQERRLAAKGALEGILEHAEAGEAVTRAAKDAHDRMARSGMRVLAVGARTWRAGDPRPFTGDRETDERGLALVGLLGFRDPLRPEAREAVAACRRAGIAIKIVTGDHPATAEAIAREAGLDVSGGVLTGAELLALPPEGRAERVRRASVLARIAPEQKHDIVEALAAAGEITAMTGDGVNDAPALRRADVGISMGRRGTTVARGAADLVLLEDDLGAIVHALVEGRRVFRNLQLAFLYLIAFHVPIVGLALIVPLADLPILLLPLHVVWLELIVHPVSALVFEDEPVPDGVLTSPPRDPGAPLLPGRLVARSLATGVLLTAAVLGAHVMRLEEGLTAARSLAMTTLVLGSLVLVWAERAGERPLLRTPPPRGARSWIVLLAVLASIPACLHVRPLAEALDVAPLAPSEWALAATLAFGAVGWRIFVPLRTAPAR